MKTAIKLSLSLILIAILLFSFRTETKLPRKTKIDRLVVIKGERKMLAFSKGELKKTYNISLGKIPEGKKQFEGDKKTPEGKYTINDKNLNSAYYKNLGISYPNKSDRKFASQAEKLPGGAIKIHGLPNGLGGVGRLHRWIDWTQGCIAVTNDEMDELFNSVSIGTPIEIKQ